MKLDDGFDSLVFKPLTFFALGLAAGFVCLANISTAFSHSEGSHGGPAAVLGLGVISGCLFLASALLWVHRSR